MKDWLVVLMQAKNIKQSHHVTYAFSRATVEFLNKHANALLTARKWRKYVSGGEKDTKQIHLVWLDFHLLAWSIELSFVSNQRADLSHKSRFLLPSHARFKCSCNKMYLCLPWTVKECLLNHNVPDVSIKYFPMALGENNCKSASPTGEVQGHTRDRKQTKEIREASSPAIWSESSELIQLSKKQS